MTFRIDTGDLYPDIRAISADVEDTQRVRIVNHKRAQNLFNKIVENIQAHECPHQLDAYMDRESLVLDALHIFDPFVSAEIRDTYEMHRSCLVHGGAARRAQPGNPSAQEPTNGKDGKERKD